MPSDLQVTNIRDQANANSAISIASDGQITVNQNNPTLTLGSNATGFIGIKIYDNWRITTSLTTTSTSVNIKDNLERNDTANAGLIGSAMSVNSDGIWTFPMTGIYMIGFNAQLHVSSFLQYIRLDLDSIISGATTNLSQSFTYINRVNSVDTYASTYQEVAFDVVDTSTHKIAFKYHSSAGGTTPSLWGSTTYNGTNFTFMRMGDT